MPAEIEIPVERHPWPPFIPSDARLLLMGTFPPRSHRWSMQFFYPNATNDFWKIFGLVFMGDPGALYDSAERRFRVDAIKALLTERRIGLAATALSVRRLQGNASDKHLEIVERVDLSALLTAHPTVGTLATTGEKAAEVIAEQTLTAVPKIGTHVTLPPTFAAPQAGHLEIWRLPSTSRAYPLPLARKAEAYAALFRAAGVL